VDKSTISIINIITMLALSLFLLLPPLFYTIYPRIRSLLIPPGLKGIPTLKSGVPIWGDLPLMGKSIGDHDSFSWFFDWLGKELGVIGQVRVGWFFK
jgi:hypothetical protein